MSTTTSSKPVTPSQRGTEATSTVAAYLHLDNVKLLNTALLEVIAELVRTDSNIAQRVKDVYEQLATPKLSTRKATTRAPKAEKEPLVPIREIPTHHVSIIGKLDPYFLLDLYGTHQLERALSDYKKDRLQEAVQTVQKRNPGTKPNKSTKDGFIAYIVEYATNGK